MFAKYRRTLGPLFLILACPPFAIILWYTMTQLSGSLAALTNLIIDHGFWTTLYDIWSPVFWGSATAWQMIAYFAVLQLVFMRVMPGKRYQGPTTATGYTPEYKENGIYAFLTTIILYCTASFYLKIFSPTIIYDHLGELFGALNILSLVVCLLLYLKGRYAPSSEDSSTTGNFIFDYYWGTELYPRVLGWPIKMFIASRFGMMSWGLILISYAAKQNMLYSLSNTMLISVLLQLIYITKFYIWERGYLSSLDMMHDRAGFYICWGCMVWVPCVYTSPSMYLVHHPLHLSNGMAILTFVMGTTFILVNYFADRQRQMVRRTNGNCKVWGKTPTVTYASYRTHDGGEKRNILLASGWWGLARHFHYVPEILAALTWTIPFMFNDILQYFYVIFLTILLVDRAFRDDERCSKKYGQDWQKYCQMVPYKIIPYVI